MSDRWAEYDAAATWCAKRGVSGNVGSALPQNMSADTVAEICRDPDAFRERVRATAYALAMAQHDVHGE